MVWGEGENVFTTAFPAPKTAEHVAELSQSADKNTYEGNLGKRVGFSSQSIAGESQRQGLEAAKHTGSIEQKQSVGSERGGVCSLVLSCLLYIGPGPSL